MLDPGGGLRRAPDFERMGVVAVENQDADGSVKDDIVATPKRASLTARHLLNQVVAANETFHPDHASANRSRGLKTGAAHAVEPVVVDGNDTHDITGVRGVNHHPVADVHRDVVDCVPVVRIVGIDDEITGLHCGYGDGGAGKVLVVRQPGHQQSGLAVRPLHETAAVEGVRALGPPDIVGADLGQCGCYGGLSVGVGACIGFATRQPRNGGCGSSGFTFPREDVGQPAHIRSCAAERMLLSLEQTLGSFG